MGEPQLMSGGVDSWFAKALEAAKAVIAGALLGRAAVPRDAAQGMFLCPLQERGVRFGTWYLCIDLACI